LPCPRKALRIQVLLDTISPRNKFKLLGDRDLDFRSIVLAVSSAAAREANISLLSNIEKHRQRLQELATNPALLEDLAHPETEEEWEIWEIVQIGLAIGMMFKRIAESPPSKGYEPFLVNQGTDRIVARGMSQLAVKHGNRIANEHQCRASVVRAIQFLSNPRRSRPARLRRVKLLLAAANETTVVQTLFVEAGLEEFSFVRLLQSAAEGNDHAFAQLAEIARSLPLKARRGPKIKAPSAAHQFLFEGLAEMKEPRAFTWNEVEGRCTDDFTEAARREFYLKRFDPRSAYRRMKAAKI
jgi:hypothetical protein